MASIRLKNRLGGKVVGWLEGQPTGVWKSGDAVDALAVLALGGGNLEPQLL